LTIGGATFNVTQLAGCGTTISPTSQSFSAAGGTGSSAVSAATGCAWDSVSNVAWISIFLGGSGSGNGSVTFVVGSYTGTTSRTGTLTIAGNTFTVTQVPTCTFTVSPQTIITPGLPASGTLLVTTQSGCAWTASSSASWITVTASGTGSKNASYNIAENTALTSRTATLTVAGKTITVTQGAKPTAPMNVRIVR
jgi:hypothetical protein